MPRSTSTVSKLLKWAANHSLNSSKIVVCWAKPAITRQEPPFRGSSAHKSRFQSNAFWVYSTVWVSNLTATLNISIYSFKLVFNFFQREAGKHWCWLPPICTLTQDRTRNLPVHRMMLPPTEPQRPGPFLYENYQFHFYQIHWNGHTCWLLSEHEPCITLTRMGAPKLVIFAWVPGGPVRFTFKN